MAGLPRMAQVYIANVGFLALLAAVVAIPYLPRDTDSIVSVMFFTAAACTAQVFRIALPRVRAEFAISTAITIAVAILFNPAVAIWSSLVSAAISNIVVRRPWTRVVFNASQYSLTYGAAALVYHAAWSGPPLANLWPATAAVLALGDIYFVLNTGFVFLILSLVDRTPFLRLWRMSAQRVIIHDFVMVAVGLVFAVLWTYNRWSIPLIVPLVIVLYQSMSAVGKMEKQTKDALLALANVIDQRDCQTFAHSERVAEYVGWICEEMRLPADETEIIVYGARLHDLGKVGVPDGLLLKPGKLTPEEQAEFQRHPEIGADIIAQFPIFRDGTEIVRHEHEWFNGQGYPRGVRGDAIPLGSRIIAVADAYEAMTTDRPYRQGMPREVAMGRLREASGSQFDPAAVDAFLAALGKRYPVAAEASTEVDASATRPDFVVRRGRTNGRALTSARRP